MISVILKGTLSPTGGPSGYLYNLKESLEKNKVNDIHIVYIPHSKEVPKKSSVKDSLKKIVPIPQFIKEKRKIASYKSFLEKNIKTISASKILHFHSTLDLYYFSKIYNLDKHSVLLMSHAPEVPHIELFNSHISKGLSQDQAKNASELQRQIDIFSFQKANYLIFPCEGAVTPYKDFFMKHQVSLEKLRYVLTSSKPLVPKLSVEQYKNNHSIPQSKTIVSYIGRKNSIKGYDIFCDIVQQSKDNDQFHFISAGTGNISSPQQNNFTDIGWTNDPASFVNASDILIVPNRDTYFDLGIIQALSLNKTIITTKTGGNTWFEDKGANVYFANPKTVSSFLTLLNNKEIYQENNSNQHLYESYFNNDTFALNYQKLYQSLLIESS